MEQPQKGHGRGNAHPEGPSHPKQSESPWGVGAKNPSWEQDEWSLLIMEPLGNRMKSIDRIPMGQGTHGSSMVGVY